MIEIQQQLLCCPLSCNFQCGLLDCKNGTATHTSPHNEVLHAEAHPCKFDLQQKAVKIAQTVQAMRAELAASQALMISHQQELDSSMNNLQAQVCCYSLTAVCCLCLCFDVVAVLPSLNAGS